MVEPENTQPVSGTAPDAVSAPVLDSVLDSVPFTEPAAAEDMSATVESGGIGASKIIIAVLAVVILVLLLIVVALAASRNSNPTPTPTPTTTSTVTPTGSATPTASLTPTPTLVQIFPNTYSNTTYRYSIQYPSSLQAKDDLRGPVNNSIPDASPTNIMVSFVVGNAALPQGGTLQPVVDIGTYPWFSDSASFADFAEGHSSSYGNQTCGVKSQEQLGTVGMVTSVEVKTFPCDASGGVTQSYFKEYYFFNPESKIGYLIRVYDSTVRKYQTIVEQMLSTFSFPTTAFTDPGGTTTTFSNSGSGYHFDYDTTLQVAGTSTVTVSLPSSQTPPLAGKPQIVTIKTIDNQTQDQFSQYTDTLLINHDWDPCTGIEYVAFSNIPNVTVVHFPSTDIAGAVCADSDHSTKADTQKYAFYNATTRKIYEIDTFDSAGDTYRTLIAGVLRTFAYN